MKQLNIFDFDGSKISTITWNEGLVFVFARSSREWHEMQRLLKSGYKVSTEHPKFLDYVAERAQTYDYNTELVNDVQN